MARTHLIRNKDGIWINTKPFREPALFFKKHGYYNADPVNSPEWIEYWNEQRNRAINGYTVGGVTITGDHYFFINFTNMQKAEAGMGNAARKVVGMPDFRDSDYNYFWARELARNGVFSLIDEKTNKKLKKLKKDNKKQYFKELKKIYDSLGLWLETDEENLEGGTYDFVVGKARRQGFSYKAASISAKNWALIPNSTTILAAYNFDFLLKDGLYTKARNVVSFIREHTAWGHPSDVVDSNSKGIIRASYWENVDGRKVEKGFKSTIKSVTYNNSTDVTRGADVHDIFFEESGAAGSPGRLKETINATYYTVRAGSLKTGLITVFGTSGDVDEGSKDYGEILLNPKKHGFFPFKNIWDEGEYDNEVGYFQPISWSMEGFYDENGNSDIEGARQYELAVRKRMTEAGATATELHSRMMEAPLTPIEAFGSTGNAFFPIQELRRQLRKVEANKIFELRGTPVHLTYENGKVVANPILNGKCIPISKYNGKVSNPKGCPVIYEYPVEGAPKNSYKIGYDPVAHDLGTSYAAIIVYKSVIQGSQTHDIIVAEYVGRPELAQDADRIAEMFADLYNSQIMHENMDKGTRTYFRRIKRLNLLASQPDAVINNNVKNSRVARVYGSHMNKELKRAGERYIKEWLLGTNNYDEYGNPIKNYELIPSTRLLEELIAYESKGNYDLVSALIMALFMVQEQTLPTRASRDDYVNRRLDELDDLLDDDIQI